jgi:hypothetical protein
MVGLFSETNERARCSFFIVMQAGQACNRHGRPAYGCKTGASDTDGLFNFFLPVRTSDPLFEKPVIEAVASALY